MNAKSSKDFEATVEAQQRYRVVMDGTIQVGADREFVIKKLSRLFGTDRKSVEALLDGDPLVIKKNLPERRAHQYFRTITNAGAVCHLEEISCSNMAGTPPGEDARPIDGTSLDKDIRRQVAERIRSLSESPDVRMDDNAAQRAHDKIVYLLMFFMIFGLLAVIYLII